MFSVVTKCIVLAFAIAGKAHLWASISVDVGAMILVTLNAMTIIPHHCRACSQEVSARDIKKQKCVEDMIDDCLRNPCSPEQPKQPVGLHIYILFPMKRQLSTSETNDSSTVKSLTVDILVVNNYASTRLVFQQRSHISESRKEVPANLSHGHGVI
jgi:hypothetical protein